MGADGLILRDDFEDTHAGTSQDRKEHKFEFGEGGVERRIYTIPM